MVGMSNQWSYSFSTNFWLTSNNNTRDCMVIRFARNSSQISLDIKSIPKEKKDMGSDSLYTIECDGHE